MKSLPAAALVAATLALGGQAGAAERVYIPLGSANAALIVDPTTDRIVGRIAGLPNVHGLAATSDGRLLIAASLSESAVGVAAAPAKPAGMAESDHKAHHSDAESGPQTGAVSMISFIDTASAKIVHRIRVPGAVHHVAITPDGRYAILTHPGTGRVSIVDVETFAVIATVPTGPAPNYAVVSPDGSRVFVSNAGNDTVSELDPVQWTVRRTIATGEKPEHMVLSPDGRRLYVANVAGGTVSVIDTEAGSVRRTFEVGGMLHGIDLSGDGGRLFVSARERGELVAIDLPAGAMTRIPLGPAPYHAAAVRGTGKLYVSSAAEPKVWVVDQASLRPLGEIAITGVGHQMAVALR